VQLLRDSFGEATADDYDPHELAVGIEQSMDFFWEKVIRRVSLLLNSFLHPLRSM
jgi:hypothetical protein